MLLAAVTNPPVVAVRDLAAGYGGPPVLEDVAFSAGAGQRVAVLGPNGGGKSTLFRVLLGELGPLRGSIDVHGRSGTVPQTERSRLDYPVSALDVALMGSLSRLPWWRRPGRGERRRALDALGAVGLADLASATFGELSGGQRQRVLVARALVQDATLILLDEPYSGVDEPTERQLTELFDGLAGEGRTLLMATHDMEQARSWDLVLCLNRKQVAFGPPDAVLTRPVLEATYGEAIVALPSATEQQVVVPPHHHSGESA
jgi:ABC-type Mn2+/Zn2+ transport system ATPase subunit